MKAIVLAGGFARRLLPLSRDTPKPLLKVGAKPMIDYVIDKILEVGVDEVLVSTNLKFKQDFEKWMMSRKDVKARIIVEPAVREEEKPGAAVALAMMSKMIQDDCLVVAGDNLFTASIKPLSDLFRASASAVIGLYDVADRQLAKQYSTITVDSNHRIVEFVEKPSTPRSTLIGTCIYFLPRKTVPRLEEFIEVKGKHDSPGRFIEWLYKQEPVYGLNIGGDWWDIGTIGQYERVNGLMARMVSESLQK
ncbi:MAG TPA: nucleotidyltransferase family protein [Candidatus Bathyarchaeia archaeon]|nr:nucleotidyltransferase family protein [Candidatus Bathyarchaeia archaeon]